MLDSSHETLPAFHMLTEIWMNKQQSKEYIKIWEVSIEMEGTDQYQPKQSRCNTFHSMTEALNNKHKAKEAACGWQQTLLN